MSDYCKPCRYDPRQRTGADACPFNPLYWDFLIRNREKLGGNNRMAMVYRNLDRLTATDQKAIQAEAERVKTELGATVR